MDDAGLHPTLLPANPLREPILELVRASSVVSESRSDLIAVAGQPDSEVRVLRHVPFVPCADAHERGHAEMVGRAPERDRPAQRAEAGIDEVEQRRVFQGEDAESQELPALRTVRRA